MSLAQDAVYNIELTSGTSVVNLTAPLVEGDDKAQTFRLKLTKNGSKPNLTSTACTAYFLRSKTQEAEAATIVVPGTISNDEVTVTLPASCYAYSCYFGMHIRLANASTGQKRTVMIVRGTVLKSVDGNVVDPEGSIPSLDDIFAQIAAMEAAADNANAAAEYANQAASSALNTTLYLMGVAAPAIIQSINGDGIVAAYDSAERALIGMSLYGKTTQTGTPTPETPAPLINAGKDDIIRFYVRGKNIFQDKRTSTADYTSNGVTFVTNADGTFTANGTNDTTTRSSMTLTASSRWLYLPAGTYTVSSGLPNDDGYFQLSHNDTMESAGSTAIYVYATPKTFTIDKPKYAWMALNVLPGKTVENLVFKPQIEVGAVATEYEPYNKDGGQGIVIVTDEAGIPGIPVSSGGNYIDKNGQQWVCDEIDFTRKVYVKRLHTLTLEGSQSMRWYTDERMPFGGAIQITLSSSYHAAIPHRNKAISDRFVNKNNVAASFSHGVFGVTASGQSMFFSIEGVADADAAKAWFSANPTNILYALATPIETPLPPEQIDTTTLTAQYPNTTVFNNAGAGMKMDYVADTKIYIDNKFAALAAASVNA